MYLERNGKFSVAPESNISNVPCRQSTLLMSLLGEVPRLGGFVRSRGQLGFVPQHSWIFSATFRENIIFGLDMDRRKYNKVLYACDLVKVSYARDLVKVST